jgi:dihydroorotase
MLLIKNGKIIENNKLVNKDILLSNNLISKISENINENCEILDASGCLVMPGAVDVHVHLREPGFEKKETIKTGTLSAAKGGITTIMPMPNLNPCPDNLENLQYELNLLKKDSVVNAYPYGSVSVGENDEMLSDIESMKDYLTAISDDGKGVNNVSLLKKAMILAKKHNLVIASHAEDSVDGYKPQGEYVAVRREIELAKEIGCKYHFCHMSTKESFEAIRKAHSEGFTNITCEVSPHHLILNETMIKNANWKMNPPLRSEENRLEAIKALIDGTACMIASDHAPHTIEEKSREYNKCPNGIIGLETMLPIIYTYFVKTNIISLDRFLDLLVYNPCKVFNLPLRDLKEGSIADIAVLDITNTRKYTKEEIVSKGTNSPYIGMEFTGFPICTICNGKIIYKK